MAYPINVGHNHNKRVIIVPPTTDMALVFPFDHENKRFDKSFYSHFLTDGRASNEQIELFLKEVEEVYRQKLMWLRRFKAYLVFAFITGILLMSLYSFAIFSDIDDSSYDYNHQDYNKHTTTHNTHNSYKKNLRHHNKSHEYDIEEQLDSMFVGWMFLLFAAMVWGLVFSCFQKSSIKKAREGVQKVLDKYASLFSNTGLRWNLPLAFPHYIELWKDYKGQTNPQSQNNQLSYNINPSNYHQTQNQNQNQKYPNLHQVVDQRAYLDIHNNGVANPLLNNQTQRNDYNSYVPPYPSQFVNNTQ